MKFACLSLYIDASMLATKGFEALLCKSREFAIPHLICPTRRSMKKIFNKCCTYQKYDMNVVQIQGKFILIDKMIYGFKILEDYDRQNTLVIDPYLEFSTYIGGSGEDQCYDVAVDTNGSAYLTGYTYSSNFPTTPGVYQTSKGA